MIREIDLEHMQTHFKWGGKYPGRRQVIYMGMWPLDGWVY